MSDNVKHPSHYANNCSLECIDVMRVAFGRKAVSWFCLCNAFKYLWRWKYKNGFEDLQKAKWYLDAARKEDWHLTDRQLRSLSELSELLKMNEKEYENGTEIKS